MRARHKLAQGVGINDADYMVVIAGKDGKAFRCKIYSTWSNMLKRAYSKAYHKKGPSYIDVTVCKEWMTFSNFKKWMKGQDSEGKELDKDIISIGNREYCPYKCCFVSNAINSLLLDNKKNRGKHPLGVDYVKRDKKFRARCNDLNNGAIENVVVGYYDNTEQASKEYRKYKYSVVKKLACLIQDTRIKNGLLSHAELFKGQL